MLESLLQMDGQLLVNIQGIHMAWLDPVVSVYTKLGDAGILWIALSLAMLVYKPTRKAGALALGAMILGLLVTNVTIKPLVERARPWTVWPIDPLVTEKDPNSFPSGHTCAAFAAGMIWLRALPWKWGRVAAPVLAVLIPDEPGGLHKVLEVLREAAVNVEYMYAFLGGDDVNHAYMIFRVADNAAAASALAQRGIQVVEQEEIDKL